MNKYDLNEGNDALKRILLMMKYDNKKTLSENKESIVILNEEQTTKTDSSIVTDEDLTGDTSRFRSWIQYWSDNTIGFNTILDVLGVNITNLMAGRRVGVKGVVDALDGFVDEKDLAYVLSVIQGLKGKTYLDDTIEPPVIVPAIKRFLELYSEDEGGDDLIQDIQSIGTRTLPVGTEKTKTKIANLINQLSTEQVKPKPDVSPKPVVPPKSWKDCKGTYTQGCKSDVIRQVQGCMNIVTDSKFGPKTQKALESKGFKNGFTDKDVTTICKTSQSKTELPKPESGITPEINVDNTTEI